MKKQKIVDPYELDEYEQEIIDNIHLAESYSPEETKRKLDELVAFAESHIEARAHVDLDMAIRDLEEVKYRASKIGIPYKTLINMVIHRYAISPQKEILV